jgi:hypothetical protein
MEVFMFGNRFASLFVWAGGAFGVALALGLPGITNAVDDSKSGLRAENIAKSRVTVNGIELSVTREIPATQPAGDGKEGANPLLKLVVHAVNQSGAEAQGDFHVEVESVTPTSPMARTTPMPQEVWGDSGSMVLNAGESKTFTFTSSPVPGKKELLVTIIAGQQSVQMMSLAPQADGQYTEIQ